MTNTNRWTVGMCSRVLLVLFFVLLSWAPMAVAAQPRNIILLIGDGMGPEQLKAASLYAYGKDGRLAMQQLPVKSTMSTRSANKPITDSAASATAMATGVKVNNGVISLAIPGDGQPLKTILEKCADQGKWTGLVTSAYMTHATPAAFGSHTTHRNNAEEIAYHYLNKTKPNLLLGGGGKGMTVEAAQKAGYTVATTRDELKVIDLDVTKYISGQFREGHMPYEYEYANRINDGYDELPHLNEMATFAVQMLDRNENGFFLMIEGGRIDHAGHAHDLQNNIFETLEFDNTVKAVLRWAANRDDTLVVVTSDHECGGLKVEQSNGRGEWPSVKWTKGGHTGIDVPLFAWGVGAQAFSEKIDNTDMSKLLMNPVVKEEAAEVSAAE